MSRYILLCPNAHRDIGLAQTVKLAEALRVRGHEVRISPFLSDGMEHTFPEALSVMPLREALPDASLVVTLGGDGTILQISRYLAGTGIPIIGVNMGHKGFLTELETDDVEDLLSVADGEYLRQERMMLEVELVRDGKVVCSDVVINEATLRSVLSVIHVSAFGDGKSIMSFSGDGLIVSTPTGSTAYSMASGGPIVEPDADCLILTPICTFRLAARSIVLTKNRRIVVRLSEQGDKGVLLSLDGGSVPFLDGDELRIRCSEKTLTMAHLEKRTFYDIVFEKLNDKSELGGGTV